jgi:hypothetical protein
VHTFVHGRLFDPHFGPSLLVLPSLVRGVLYCRRHNFAAWIVGVVERSGFSGNVSGDICGWRTSRRQSAGVWDPDSSSGAGRGLVDPSDFWRPELATLLTFPSAEHTQE